MTQQTSKESFAMLIKSGRSAHARHRLLAGAIGGAIGGATLLATPVMAADGLTAAVPTIRTAAGVVAGTRVGTVDEFLGVPYAAAPVGALRFRPPQPLAPFTTTRQATQFAQPCPQLRPTAIGSEDCLYLNVYAPDGNVSDRRPVMVYFPGGGFTAGSASNAYYNGQAIVQQSGVIVVVVTYRVGAFGFLTAPALDGESTAKVSGNYGLLDQQASLRWVKQNIRAFGGDPANVTVFGESAGADSIEYQLTSPGAAGLFEHAIMDSSVGGFQIPSLPLAVSEQTGGAAIVAAVGCADAADVAACLRAVRPFAFLAPVAANPGSTLPVVDGVVVPQAPLAAYRSGTFNHVPVIFGTNHDEGTVFVDTIEPALGGPLTPAGYITQLRMLYGADALKVLAQYPLSAYPSLIQALAAVFTDGNTACPTSEKRAALKRYVAVYGYELNEPNPAQGPLLGPPEPGLNYLDYHTADLPYVFGVTAPAGVPVTGKDLALSQSVINYYTNFAIAGNPNLKRLGNPFWFDERLSPSLLSLTDQIVQLSEAKFRVEHKCSFWDGALQG